MASTIGPRKRGQLSLEEEKFITDNFPSLTIEQIAETLNRNTAPVQRYINENRLLVSVEEKNDTAILKQKLHTKTFWSEIKRQFDEETGELTYFEDTWIGLIKQFREDVLPAEELQIKQFKIGRAHV